MKLRLPYPRFWNDIAHIFLTLVFALGVAMPMREADPLGGIAWGITIMALGYFVQYLGDRFREGPHAHVTLELTRGDDSSYNLSVEDVVRIVQREIQSNAQRSWRSRG